MKKALCFASGVLLSSALLLLAVLAPALSTARFERALVKTVNMQALGISPSDLSAFAADTMGYLRGEKALWQPPIPRTGVPEAFSEHMAQVKSAVSIAPWLILGLLAAGIGLLGLGGWKRRYALLGVFALIAFVLLVLLWAAVDFASFWMVLHRAFIRGGIFPSGEPVMQLFPLSLFFQYMAPVCLWALGLTGVLCGALCLKHR